jgi:hypothetical protein
MFSLRTLEKLENRLALTSEWQNVLLPLDVDSSSFVSSLDALILVNEINRNGSRSLIGSQRLENDPYFDVNGDGALSPVDVLVVINALNREREPMILVAGVAPESDPNGNGVVARASVFITGQTFANTRVLWSVGEHHFNVINSFVTTDNGQFALEIPLDVGTNAIQVRAMDEIGRVVNQSIKAERGNVITDWNAAALNVIRDWTAVSNDPYVGRIVPSQPPRVARNLAMIQSAMFDAVNATSGEYMAYAYTGPVETDASPIAAAAAAAYRVASSIYSDADEVAIWDATLDESIRSIANDTARSKGLALGRRVGDAIIAARVNDGSASTSTYRPGNEPGDWNRTYPDNLPPLLPQWPNVKPFAISSGSSYRPVAPPELTTVEYATAVDQVMRLGRLESTERTQEQTEIALFWADGGGTATPPGHWNRIASSVINKHNLTLIESARTLALMNLALADAGIASWDAKYHYDLWRPIDAIREAATDQNPATIADPNWLPLLKTPPFPAYTSGHSTFSGAAAAVLTRLFGNGYAFCSTTDPLSGLAQRPLADSLIVTRQFDSFEQAAEEAGMSRIYGGIHFVFDNTAGLQAGGGIGDFVAGTMLKKR